MEYIAALHLHANNARSDQPSTGALSDETHLVLRTRHRRRTSFGRIAKSLFIRSRVVLQPSLSPERWDSKAVDDLATDLKLCVALSHTLDEQAAKRASRLWAEPRISTSSVAFVDKPLPQRPAVVAQHDGTKQPQLHLDAPGRVHCRAKTKCEAVNIAELLDKNAEAISWDQGWRSVIARFPFPPFSPELPDSDDESTLEPSRTSSMLDFDNSSFDTDLETSIASTTQDTATSSHPQIATGGLADLISACGLATPKHTPSTLAIPHERMASGPPSEPKRALRPGWFYFPAL